MIYAMLMLSLGPLLYELPLSTAVICSLILLLSIRQSKIPFWVQQSLAVLTGFSLYFWHGTLQTPEAASSLIAVALCLKMLNLNSSRDHMILLMINLLAVMCYVLFSQTLLSTVILFTNYVIFILRLLDLQKQKLNLPLSTFNLRQLITPETMVALPLLICLFVFFPRFSTPWTGIGAATANQITGFANNLNPGQIQSLSESEEVAFRVTFKNNQRPSPESLYFRGGVLTSNKEWLWENVSPPPQNLHLSAGQVDADYEILLEPRFEKTLFTLETTAQISLQPEHLRFYKSNTGEFSLRWPIQGKIKINGVQGENEKFDSAIDNNPEAFLQVNTQVSPQMQQLVNQTKNKSAVEKVQTLLNFFARNSFKYSTQTPAYASVDRFLFGERIGFCEHYAASFAVLARLAGIPTRVVSGFQGAEFNDFGSFFVVRDKHAHAWNEVYFADKGWIRIDVTSIVAPARIQQGALYNRQSDSLLSANKLSLLERTVMAWDAVNNRFNLFLMNYNLENQTALLERFSLKQLGLKSVTQVFTAVAVLFLFLFWLVSFSGKTHQDDIAKGYLLLNQRLLKTGISRAASEGPNDLRKKLVHLPHPPEKALELIERYIQLRFGPDASPKEAKRFYKDVKALKVYK